MAVSALERGTGSENVPRGLRIWEISHASGPPPPRRRRSFDNPTQQRPAPSTVDARRCEHRVPAHPATMQTQKRGAHVTTVFISTTVLRAEAISLEAGSLRRARGEGISTCRAQTAASSAAAGSSTPRQQCASCDMIRDTCHRGQVFQYAATNCGVWL